MPQDTTLPVGETVTVKIAGAVVQQAAPLVVRAGSNEEILVPTGAEVEVVNPLNWPPLAGDVWKDGTNVRWFATMITVQGEPKLRLISSASGGNPQTPQQVKTDHRPLTLEYRA